jgi:16S rRNA (guanine966-N2)-methyltransferase
VAGELGGRRLLAPRGRRVRPTSDRVREAVFSALGEIEGARVLELYCGTGALSIESLSRGAAHATMVDKDTRPALGNVRNLGLAERAELVRADVLGWVRGAAEAPAGSAYDLVFIDPPYRIADRLGAELDPHLARLLAPGGRVITESSTRRPLQLTLPVLRERRYGSTQVVFHEAGGS